MSTLYYLQQYISKTLNTIGGIDASQTSDIELPDVTGIDYSKPGIACLSYSDPIDTDNAEWITYTSINNTTKKFVGVTRGQEGYSAKAHAKGVTIAFPISESHINNINELLQSGSVGQVMVSDGSDSQYQDLPQSLYRQVIINGNFDVWQRGTSFTAATTPANNDDTFLMDRWNLLSDGNDIVDVSRSTDAPNGSKYSAKFLVATANKKFGIVYLMENLDAMKLDNQTVSLSFQAKTTTAKVINNLRCAVLSWNSTADAVTSDVVSAWAVSGTNPTWATNWTAENVAANIAITTSWAEYSVEGITIDTASMANIAVVIWVDDTDAALNDELLISQVQLCAGSVALPFQPKSFEEELRACQRYFEKSYDIDVDPGTNTTTGQSGSYVSGINSATHIIQHYQRYKVEKRDNATVTAYAGSGNSGKVDVQSGEITPSSIAEGTGSFRVQATDTVASTVRKLWYQWTADAEL